MPAAASDLLRRLIETAGSEQAFNWTFHVARNPGFIYVSNPICACSTLKLSLNLSVARLLGRKDFSIDSAADIHRRPANLLQTPRQVGYDTFVEMLQDPEIKVFTFARNPESRFLSAFVKKLSARNPISQRVRHHLGVGPEVPLTDFLSLDAFARAVADDHGLRDLDEHWRLQRRQVFFDILPRLEFGRVENFKADAAAIFGSLFGHDGYILRDATELSPANASASRKSRGDLPVLSPEAKAHIARAYAEDFAMLEEVAARKPLEIAPLPARAATTGPRLILHIGMGKTGTSSIQQGLSQGAAQLGADRMAYLGMWFDLVSPDYAGLAKQAKFFALSPSEMRSAADVFHARLVERQKASGVDTFILSNESLAGKADRLAPFLSRLAQLGTGLRIIAYMRNPHDWLPSAYVQWGIRDKTYSGPVEPYGPRARKFVTWYRGLRDWCEGRHGKSVELRSYEAADDVLADFAAAIGARLPALPYRVLERGEPAEIVLRALFNSRQAGPALPDLFDKTVLDGLGEVPRLDELMTRHFDYDETAAIVDEQKPLFDRLTELGGFDPRQAPVRGPRTPDITALRERLLDHLIGLVLTQSERIARLEEAISKR